MNYFFKDEKNQLQFDKNGFVILDLFDTEEVNQMLNFLHHGNPDLKHGKFSSILHWDFDQNRKLNDLLAILINPKLYDILPDWQVLNGSFIVKSSAEFENTSFSLHQDFNLVSVNDLPSIGMWIALVDTSKENGGLCVLPGSHNKFGQTIRGVNIPSLNIEFDDEVNQIVEYLDIKKGQVCLFNHSLFHGSPSNTSNAIRPIIHAGIFPPEFTRVHYYKSLDNNGVDVVEEIEIDHNYYSYNMLAFCKDPKSGPYKVRRVMNDYTPTPTRELVLESYGVKSSKKPLYVHQKNDTNISFVQKVINFIKRR